MCGHKLYKELNNYYSTPWWIYEMWICLFVKYDFIECLNFCTHYLSRIYCNDSKGNWCWWSHHSKWHDWVQTAEWDRSLQNQQWRYAIRNFGVIKSICLSVSVCLSVCLCCLSVCLSVCLFLFTCFCFSWIFSNHYFSLQCHVIIQQSF